MSTSEDSQAPEKPQTRVLWKGSHLGGTLTLAVTSPFPSVIFFDLDVFDIHLEGTASMFTLEGKRIPIERVIELIDALYESTVLGEYQQALDNGMKPS